MEPDRVFFNIVEFIHRTRFPVTATNFSRKWIQVMTIGYTHNGGGDIYFFGWGGG